LQQVIIMDVRVIKGFWKKKETLEVSVCDS